MCVCVHTGFEIKSIKVESKVKILRIVLRPSIIIIWAASHKQKYSYQYMPSTSFLLN